MPSAVQQLAINPTQEALSVLVAAGAPVGGSFRVGPPPTPSQIASALRAVMLPPLAAKAGATRLESDRLEPWVLEAVGAFTLGWAHEWPTSFGTEFGREALGVTAWARAHTPDAGRYLKLRRLAVSNLAGVL